MKIIETSTKVLTQRGVGPQTVEMALTFAKLLGFDSQQLEELGKEIYLALKRGEPFAGYSDWDDCIAKNQDKDDPAAYCGKIQDQYEELMTEIERGGPFTHKKVARDNPLTHGLGFQDKMIARVLPDETKISMRLISGLRKESLVRLGEKHIEIVGDQFTVTEAPFKEGFRWMKGKTYHVPPQFQGISHIYAFRTLNIPMTLNGAKWTVEEKRLASRTLIGHPVNLNHEIFPEHPELNFVIDSEFEDGWIEGFSFVTDEQINRLYDEGHIIGCSVEYYPRHEDWTNGWSVEGNRFVGLAFVSDEYMMGAPESIVTRTETFVPPDDPDVENMSGQEDAERTRETVLAEIEAEQAKLVELRAELAVFDPPEGGLELKLAKIESMLSGISSKLDVHAQRIEALENAPEIEPRKETLLTHEGGEETGTGPSEDRLLESLEQKRARAEQKRSMFG